MDGTVVASYSCHGIEPDEKGTGQNKINQDCACVCYPYCGDPQARRIHRLHRHATMLLPPRTSPFTLQCALFCVFDGHGRNGTAVSSALLEWCVKELENDYPPIEIRAVGSWYSC